MEDKKIKAVLFDLDDTLYDYELAHQESLKAVFLSISKITWTPIDMVWLLYEIAEKNLKRQLVGLSASHNRDLYFQKIFELFNSDIKNKISPEHIISLFQIYWDVFFKSIKKDKFSIKVLKFLKDNWIKIWIVSDSQTYVQLKKMQILWISEYVDVLVTSEEAGIEKPHQTPFLLAMHKLWVLANSSIMIWDSIKRDIDWAQALWIIWIWINRHNKVDEWVIYNHKVDTMEDLFALIQTII